MHAVCPQSTPAVKGVPPPQQSGEDEHIQLAEELSDREGISIEAAYSIVSRHFAALIKEA